MYVLVKPNKYIHKNLKECQEEGIKISPESDNTFASSLIDNCPLTHAKFAENYLRLSSISPRQNVVNLYIFLHTRYMLKIYFALGNWIFGAVKLTKNTDPDKC